MTPQTDTIPGGVRPSASISTTRNPNYMDNLTNAFSDFADNFKAEQESKQRAAEEAARAAEAAAAGYSAYGDYSQEGKESMDGFRDDGSSIGGSRAGGGMKSDSDVGYGSGTD